MQYGIYYAYWAHEWGADYLPFVEKMKKLGFDLLEISLAGLKDKSDRELSALKNACRENAIGLTGDYGPQPMENLGSADGAIVKNAFSFWQDTFQAMKKLDIHTVGGGLYSYWPADYSKPLDKEGDWERSVKNMRTLADMAKDFDITLCMEALNRHEGYLINSAKECLAYVNEVGKDNVKIHLDTYHMNCEEDDFAEAILTAGNKLGHFHVGENNRKLPGQGHMIPWEKLGKALKEIRYDGAVVMEPFVIHGGKVGQDVRIWRDLKEDCREETLDREAKESLLYLRKVFR